jgi:RNA polymerase sigma-70 factor (ECF subfamily)
MIDHFRRRRITATVPVDDVADAVWIGEDAGVSARLDLERVLASLPAEQSRLLLDVRVRGESMAGAASRSGITEGAAKVRLHRAMQRLIERFGKGGSRDDR